MTEQARTFRKRILVAEDDPAARESLSLLLRIDRHTVVEAKNGREALDLFTMEPFDLVIVDYALPEMQGHELARNIKRIAPAQPILMVTAYFEQLVDSDIPVEAILSKPFGVDELRQAIAKLLC
jgi:CheY-like chemotaxis protein